ncbi:MAG: hypothetical protein WAT93_03435 [Pontixanthobacter sp.]
MAEHELNATANRLVGRYLKTADSKIPGAPDVDRALLALALACCDRAQAMAGDLSDEWLATGGANE